jgi:DNA-binding response OmpR family regulator
MRGLALIERRVLVVEDDKTLRDIVAEALREDGYTVQTAVNGEAALELVQRWLPGLVILDLMMPRMAGEEFCAALRRLDALASVPIVLVSASRYAAEIGARVGAYASLTKPFDLLELSQHVHALLH